jgi:hypothetical protein
VCVCVTREMIRGSYELCEMYIKLCPICIYWRSLRHISLSSYFFLLMLESILLCESVCLSLV